MGITVGAVTCTRDNASANNVNVMLAEYDNLAK
jgi:hypothetical protein